jgi:hypothetical protein
MKEKVHGEMKERERRASASVSFLKTHPHVTGRLPTRPCLLKVLQPPNSVKAGNQVFNTWAFGGHIPKP